MYDHLPLSKLLNQYYLGTLDKKTLEGHIFQFIQNNFKHFHLYTWSKDDFMDFLCWFYSRISRAIDNYQDAGSSFDAYIFSMVRWSAREYHALNMDHRIVEYTCWKAKAMERALDMEVCEEEPAYLDPKPALKPVSNPRQILALVLKSYYIVSDDFLNRIAPAIGMSKEKLSQLIEELRKRRIQREEEIRELQERIFTQYYRCVSFEKKILSAPPGSAKKESLERRLVKAKKRLESMRERFANIKVEASSRQVADVMGVPKGTVDSSLYAVKTRYKADENDSGPGE
jgi:DNA-directed RNA polymerase specialized sigma24 family protein